MSEIDFGRHSEDYAEYRPGFPPSFYRRIDAITRIRKSRSLDLATGPGTISHWNLLRLEALSWASTYLRSPGGVLAIAHYSYLAGHTPVARDTEDLILDFNPSWSMAGSAGIYPELIDEVCHGGFGLVEQFCYQHEEEFSHARWRGRMRTCNGVGSGGLSPSEVLRFDDALSHLLSRKYPDPMLVEHRVWCVVARKPS